MGVKVYHNNQWQEFSSGSNTSASIIIQDEGVQLPGVASVLNFTGDGVTASGSGTTKEINVNGKFTGLSDTPSNYTGAANKLVAVNTGADGNGTALEFIDPTAPGVGIDNYVDNVTFSSGTLTLSRTGTLPDLTTTINLDDVGNRTFLKLSDTPSDYTGHAHKFVRVNKVGTTNNGDQLEFITQIPGTAVGAAGNDKQVQFNDGGSILAGANGLNFHKWVSDTITPVGPNLILRPDSNFTDNNGSNAYGGGSIVTQSKLEATTSTPWNRASITSDGGLELLRRRTLSPEGGPYIDFKSQLDGNDNEVDMDARIQMDYNLASGSINTDGDTYSSVTFETGGEGHYHYINNQNGRVTEKLRIGKNGEIGILAGISIPSPNPGPYNNLQPGTPGSNNPVILQNRSDAEKYGTLGAVIMSHGLGKSVSWSKQPVASAYVNFNGTFGSSPFTIANGGLRDAYNVSSVTDVNTGIYNVNFTTNFPNTNYTVTTSLSSNPFVTNQTHGVLYTNGYYTNYVVIECFRDEAAQVKLDKNEIGVVVHTTQ